MYYVKNPAGRIVCLDTQKDFDYFMAKTGFTQASNEEALKWQIAKSENHMEQQRRANIETIHKGGDIFFATVSGGNDGYGQASANLFRELTKLGVKISYQNRGQTIGFLFHAPYSISQIDAPYRILYTMFESTKIPADWPDYLKAADRVLVPSKWCQKVFKASGVETEVVPLGYDDRFFTYQERHNKRAKGETFTFLHYNAYNLRKGFLEVVKAFVDEFDPLEPVKMIFKTNARALPFPFDERKYPNIEVINAEYQGYQLAELCKAADCFVFPSRGEGFGITPLEAMATGATAIVPNAHGISEYFNARYMYEVKVESMCPGIYQRYKGQDVGQMVVCSTKHLREQMRYAYEHQDETIEKGRLAAKYVKQYTYAKTAEKLKAIIDEVLSKPLPEHRQSNVLSLELV